MSRPASALPDLPDADWLDAFACFRLSAEPGLVPLRPALPPMPGLAKAWEAALGRPATLTTPDARAFFAAHFTPETVSPSEAFFTGYYEPVVEGAKHPGPAFTAPLLARPADLVTMAADEERPAGLHGLSAARRAPDGSLFPYPERASIEACIGSDAFRPLVWLRDWVEVFMIHVQGSARVQLPDGETLRLTYAGRNGHPYTSVGRVLVEEFGLAPEAVTLEDLKAWLRAAGQEPGQTGRAVMHRNASYIFFDAAPARDASGPIGGAGVPLTRLRSIAVDRTHWCYGLPFLIEADLPWEGEAPTPLRRLVVAQDTGSAIIGPARVDLFLGSGEEAGRRAGAIRHRGRLTVFRPRVPA